MGVRTDPHEWCDLFNRESVDTAEFVMELEGQFGESISDFAKVVFTQESVSVAGLAVELARGVVPARRPAR